EPPINPQASAPVTQTVSMTQLAEQLATQQAYFTQLIAKQQAQIVQLQNELLELKQHLNLSATQGNPE
ncbi:MAG: hypothetical protein ACRC22_04965, partial [Shewanella sp.]